jgi:uncharacterized membrane protein (UPF0127 family)
MADVRVPLSVAFLDETLAIRQITPRMEPGPKVEVGSDREDWTEETRGRAYDSASPAQYALEVPAGSFEEHGIREGTKVLLPPELAALKGE